MSGLLVRNLILYFPVCPSRRCKFIQEPTLYVIKGIAILDNDGNRLLAKYYDPSVFPTVKEEKKFEKNLFQKTHRANAEVIMLDRLTCVYRSNVDLFFYVMGLSHENELILVSVLSCLYDAVSAILRKNVEKRTLLDNLDIIMLALDEICDGGVPLETDPQVVTQRVSLRMEESPFNDQTVTQIIKVRFGICHFVNVNFASDGGLDVMA
ncbi:coatomer subunit zeta-1 isoform X2 [Cherax quadricarinatus]|uniref:coatomer subunit zeta-1 isoform X2 n=1 Tax=Cherax quadricarinatus TaxID=27406 RepID=UPI002378F9EC|nr:coatomer subunit zeta-1-like isoform X2 [Cherax quadricarinatus]